MRDVVASPKSSVQRTSKRDKALSAAQPTPRRHVTRRDAYCPLLSGRLSPMTPEFLGGHSVASERSGVYRSHSHLNSGICRACVEASYTLLKFHAAYDFHRLAVAASNAGSPFARLTFKCPHDKSLVLHERHRGRFRRYPDGARRWSPATIPSLPSLWGAD
jgi:hypothetical protein